MADENAAPEWPDGVRDALATLCLDMEWSAVPRDTPDAAVAAILETIAPHVAAEREAAWIAGRDRAVGSAMLWQPQEDVDRAMKRIAALTPPPTSALDALVAARVAEAVARETDAKEREVAKLRRFLKCSRDEGGEAIENAERLKDERDALRRQVCFLTLCGAVADLEEEYLAAIRAPAAAKEPGHE